MTPPDQPDDFPTDPALDARLSELRDRFKAVLPERMQGVLAGLAALAPGVWDAGARDTFKAEVHGLAGSAGLFGFDDISAAASELERLIMLIAKQPAASDADMDAVRSATARLQAAVTAA